VENIFFARPADYVKATQRIHRSGGNATFIELPILRKRAEKNPPGA